LVTFVDTTSGAQIGTLTLEGSPSSVQIADGDHAVITTYITEGYNVVSTEVTVTDTRTGTKTGATFAVDGRIQDEPLLSADGKRGLIAAADGTAIIIDTTTGAQVGKRFTLAGELRDFKVVSADRALILTNVPAPYVGTGNSQVVLIEMSTGAQVGTTVTLPGDAWQAQLSGDGTRALVTTTVMDLLPKLSDPESTRIAVIDTTTGKQVGTTITVPGGVYGAQLLSVNGNHALVTAGTWGKGTTRLVVINMVTGRQAGTTLSLAGATVGSPLLSPDGSRVLVTTERINNSIRTTRVAVLRVF
jgi:hypothetical protein